MWIINKPGINLLNTYLEKYLVYVINKEINIYCLDNFNIVQAHEPNFNLQ